MGEFNVTIYAIDDVGNQASVNVTLTITDTTKPLTGNMHLFNAPVVSSILTRKGIFYKLFFSNIINHCF